MGGPTLPTTTTEIETGRKPGGTRLRGFLSRARAGGSGSITAGVLSRWVFFYPGRVRQIARLKFVHSLG
jgi:hypothetical protein